MHPPDFMPFRVRWTDSIGSPGFRDGFAAFHHGQRERWTPENWWLELGVWADGTLVGIQALSGIDFATERRGETASWLGLSFQGRGYGTEMRSAVLELLFGGLGARAASSGAVEGNSASARVSEKLGYVVSGHASFDRNGELVAETGFRLERDEWLARERPAVEIVGVEPGLPLFGV